MSASQLLTDTFNFIFPDYTPADYTDIDLTDIDNFVMASEAQSPATTIFDDWLDAIPIHDPTVKTEMVSPTPELASPTPEPQSPTPSTNHSTLMPHQHQSPPIKQEEDHPLTHYVKYYDIIDFHNTRFYHKSFAFQSLEARGGAPKNIDHRWKEYSNMSSEEVYQLIFYAKYYNGYESLTHWQRCFLEECSHLSPLICHFCYLPKGHWCNDVATGNVWSLANQSTGPFM